MSAGRWVATCAPRPRGGGRGGARSARPRARRRSRPAACPSPATSAAPCAPAGACARRTGCCCAWRASPRPTTRRSTWRCARWSRATPSRRSRRARCSTPTAPSRSPRPRRARRSPTRAGSRSRPRTRSPTASAPATAAAPTSTASDPDLALRLRLHEDRATLLLDLVGEPLDRRGYRVETTAAPVREQLAAAALLASGWDGRGPVVDPMCGSGTLLAEAGAIALGLAPEPAARRAGRFEALPGFDAGCSTRSAREPIPAPDPEVAPLRQRPRARRRRRRRTRNLEAAGLAERTRITAGDAFELAPPPGPGLVVVNPPYGERIAEAGRPLAPAGRPAQAALPGLEGRAARRRPGLSASSSGCARHGGSRSGTGRSRRACWSSTLW